MYPEIFYSNSFTLLAEAEVGKHFYWNIAGFLVHGQVLVVIWFVLLILLVLPFTDLSRIRGAQFRPAMKLAFWFFVVDFIILMWIGSQHPNEPFVSIGQVATGFYFTWFLIIVPLIGISENTLMDIATKKKSVA